ncbi:MAG TPA: hypothetical protein VKU40_02015 [Thermoanaerobaculia bacterium]|nr:hypothetical protein [Thermoanaerobaculia bacterium]
MTVSLSDFVQTLVNDAELWATLRTQPDQVLSGSGMSEEDQNLMKNGPMDELVAKLEQQGRQISFQMFIVW